MTPPNSPGPSSTTTSTSAVGVYDYTLKQPNAFYPTFGGLKSDRSRTAAGILQIVLPGVGRMYLGYLAYGIIQLFLAIFCGVGWIWSIIDGIVMLSGGVRLDGYGRQLVD
jgi:hypothetical protein